MGSVKVLIVDDNETLLFSLAKVLHLNGFEVTSAGTVASALKHITSENFDVLLSDLHMPGAGDGLTLVSAMRHANPKAITMLLSSFPEMGAAAQAILQQTDEILLKPMTVPTLLNTINQRLGNGPRATHVAETVATILERSSESCIDDWYDKVQRDESLMATSLSRHARCEHLPQVFRDLVVRLRSSKALGTSECMSQAPSEHGKTRHRQGYSAAMIVEESRILQVSIFQTLQNNLASIDFSVVLIGVMTIADEVDSQLSQAMKSFTAAA